MAEPANERTKYDEKNKKIVTNRNKNPITKCDKFTRVQQKQNSIIQNKDREYIFFLSLLCILLTKQYYKKNKIKFEGLIQHN